jgi:hypothetical protein
VFKHLLFPQFLFLITGIFLFSCKLPESENSRPPNLISEKEFTEVLLDFSLAESASSINVKKLENRKFDSIYAFNPLKERGIRQSQYDSTLVYYSNHIEAYKKVYEEVLNRLSAMEAENSVVNSDSIHK